MAADCHRCCQQFMLLTKQNIPLPIIYIPYVTITGPFLITKKGKDTLRGMKWTLIWGYKGKPERSVLAVKEKGFTREEQAKKADTVSKGKA